MFNPKDTYKRIEKLKTLPISRLYISIPIYRSLGEESKGKLRDLSLSKLEFIEENILMDELVDQVRNYDFDLILSVSKRGDKIYQFLRGDGLFEGLEYVNLPISRSNIEQFKFPSINNKKILIIDDIFSSGLTLSKLADRYSKQNKLSCLFLFGPKKIIKEFEEVYPKIKLYYAFAFAEDPRGEPIDFTDLDTILDLLKKYGASGTQIIKRAFKDPDQVAEILQS